MLGPTIGDLLPSAVGVALSPLPIVAVILMLATPKGRTNGPAFAAGWVLGLVVVLVLVLLVAGGADSSGSTRTGVDWLKLLLGVLLVGVAWKQWQSRPKEGGTPELPKWMATLQDFDPARSFAVGAALAAVNPKNLALAVAGGATIAQAGLSAGNDTVAILVFVVIASVTIVTPVVAYLTLGEKAAATLDHLRGWMAANNATIMTVVCVVLAAKLIGAGLGGLTD
jgi:threonine/homoserine/homoserine lactone efflux protein